jgi:hypothetical protein
MMSELSDLKNVIQRTIQVIDSKPGPKPGVANVVLDKESILIASLQNGLNVRQACLQAGISHTAFYDEKARNAGFSDRIDMAEQFANQKARQNIVKSINAGNVADSWKYLERKDPEFKPKSESDLLSGGQPLKTALVEFVGDDGTATENKD